MWLISAFLMEKAFIHGLLSRAFYMTPSPRVSLKAIKNLFSVLFYYFFLRLTGKAIVL